VEHQPAAPIFLALQESALGHVMRSSPALYPAVEILHITNFASDVRPNLNWNRETKGRIPLGRQAGTSTGASC
jgi:hypothetical protein